MLFTYKANTIGPLLVVQQLLKNKLIGKPATLVGNVTSKVHPYCQSAGSRYYSEILHYFELVSSRPSPLRRRTL